MSLGPMEIVLILAVALLFFGPSRLPGLGKSIGEAIRGFKKGLNTDDIHNSEQDPDRLSEAKRRESLKTEEKEKENQS